MRRPRQVNFAISLAVTAFIFATSPILAAQQPSSAASLSAAPAQPYRIIARWKISGDGGWDHLITDPGAHRLYIAHGNEVDVVDTNTGKSIGTIPNLHGVHAIALDTAGKFGYITDGGANAVVAFDRSALAITATIPAGTGPDDILFEPVTQTVWAFNGRSHDVSIISVPSSPLFLPARIPLSVTSQTPSSPRSLCPASRSFPPPTVRALSSTTSKTKVKSSGSTLTPKPSLLPGHPAATHHPAWPTMQQASASSPRAMAKKLPRSTPPAANCSPTPPSATALTARASATPTRSHSFRAATASSPSLTLPPPAIRQSKASQPRPARAP